MMARSIGRWSELWVGGGVMVLLLAALAALGTGCSRDCDTTSPRYIFYHGRLMEHHGLELVAVDAASETTSDEPIEVAVVDTSSQYRFQTELVSAMIFPDTSHWRMELTNRSPEPITIVWPDARFVDENGRAWPLYWSYRYPEIDEIEPSAPLILQSHEKIRGSIVPVGKSYWSVYDCKSYNAVRESIVPNPIQGRTEHEINARLEELMKKETPLVLLLPISTTGETIVYRLTFRVIEGYMRRMETLALEGRSEERE